MSLQELFRNALKLEQFEKVATAAGYRNFSRRGNFYCVSELNIFAAGWFTAMKNIVDAVTNPFPAASSDVSGIDLERVAECI